MDSKMTAQIPQSRLRRECFVTIGATAAFTGLLEAVLQPQFLATLVELKYTNLCIQCGPDFEHYNRAIAKLSIQNLVVRGFDFNELGLTQEMKECKAFQGYSREGVVLCHGGAGTILDAMRLDLPIIVVPNPSLLDNHQVELAEELEKQGYVIHGQLQNLEAALRKSEERDRSRTGWPPVNKGEDPSGTGVMGILDEELAYEFDTRKVLD